MTFDLENQRSSVKSGLVSLRDSNAYSMPEKTPYPPAASLCARSDRLDSSGKNVKAIPEGALPEK